MSATATATATAKAKATATARATAPSSSISSNSNRNSPKRISSQSGRQPVWQGYFLNMFTNVNIFLEIFLTLGAPARGGAANRGGPPWEKYSPQTDPTCTRAWNQTTCTHAHRTKQPAHAHGTKQPCGLIRPLKGCLKAFFRRAFTDGCL